MINSKITNTKKVFKDFAKYSVKTNITMKIIYTLAVLILAASVVLFISNRILDAAIFTVLGVIFALCAPAMEWLNVSNNKSNVGSVDEFQFYEDRFVVTSFDKKGLELSDSTLFYNRLYKVKKYLNYGYIYVNKAVAYIVDKNEFEDEKQFDLVLDRINQAIINNKKNRGTTPVVFGSQNVTAPTEEPPQDLGEPVPPPPTEEDLAYEEEQKENKRITEFEGEQKIDYEGNVTVVAEEESEENKTEVVEDEIENNEDKVEDVEATDTTLNEENDDEGDDASEQKPFDIEKEYTFLPTEKEEVETDMVEDTQPMSDEAVSFAQVNDIDDDGDETPAEQVPTEIDKYLAPQTEDVVAPVVAEQTEVEQPVQQPVEEEKLAEDKVEDAPKRKRGRPAGTTKKPKTDDGEDKPKRKRGRPAGTTKKKPTEKKTPGKRGRPVGSTKKPKTEQADKPKGKRGRPAKPKTAEELNKPKGKRGRPPKKKTEEVVTEVQPAQDVAYVEQPEQEPVVVAPVVAEQTEVEQPVQQPVVEEVAEQPVYTAPVEQEVPTFEAQPEEVVNNFEDNDDEGDETPAEQQPVDFEMPNDIGQENAQPIQEDLDEVAALQAEYNMVESQPEVVEPQPFVNPAEQQPVEENLDKGDFGDIEAPADLGTPASTTYQPPVIEDTEVDNANYNAENETFTVSTGDEGAVEPQDFDNSSYISDVDNDDNNDEGNLDGIGDIDVNIDDVSAVVDNIPEDVEGESVEDESVNEFPTDIDDDTTKNI